MTKITFARDGHVIINGERTAYYVREGSYRGTGDDRIGRWYTGKDGEAFRPLGAGSATRKAAGESVAELIAYEGNLAN